MTGEEVFGKIIQAERKAKKISQDKLAKLTGLDRTSISLIETGKRSLTFSTLLKISNALDVPPSYLLLKFESIYPEIKKLKGGKNAD